SSLCCVLSAMAADSDAMVGAQCIGGCPDHRSPLLDHRHDRENGAEPVLGDPSGPSLATNYKRR
ncbi:hypothetical protein Q2477_25635, partial [Escherichia coli]|nr:hypothetical protein [Escherichia coli]